MNDEIKEYTPSGKIKRPSYSLVASWIKESQDAIDLNMIKCLFKCCGISNSIDGTEDGLIFEFSKVQNINNKGKGVEVESEDYDSDQESETSNECESEESELDYYERNEDRNVIQDWK